MSEERKINLFVSRGMACIWTPDDWELMRSNRIMGSFIGSLAALPRQDCHEGLPLALLPEEATLLVEKGLARLIEVPSLSEIPSDEIRERSQSHRNKILSEQVELLKESRKREIERNIKQIVEGKKKKRKLSAGTSSQDAESADEDALEKQILQEEFDKISDPKTSSLSVQLFTADPWIDPAEYRECKWEYPKTQVDKLRYLTFKDLWERGYFITPGSKFGVDYLVYPGDPVKFHSHFIVMCVDKKHELKGTEIVTYGRLGQSVRKTFALAYLVDDDAVHYQSIQWAGT